MIAASAAEHIELVVFGLLVAVSALAVVARLVRIPYPILLVIGGVAIGFVPEIPNIELDPDIVLLVFLPPLLYAAAFFSNLRELRANVRPIGLLAIGLVIVTTLAVAAVAHWAIGLEWQVAFVLGAIVSPTDAVAPATILRRLGVPRRVVTIVEGENLTNDWTALVTYKFAVAAVVTGSFTLVDAGPDFILTGVGGAAIGVAGGLAIAAVRRRLDDPPTEITISLLTPYAVYLPAEELGVSGVIAAVTVGVLLGWRASELTTHTTRLQSYAIWEILQFLLNAVLFLLIGLQLPTALDALDERNGGELLGYAVLVSAVAILVRIAWVYALSAVDRNVRSEISGPDDGAAWKEVTLVAWSGMRGGVSLAAALAIPLQTDTGAGFPERDLVLFLTFSVIIATLVLQGLAFPLLIRALDLDEDSSDADEELTARIETAYAALDRIEELTEEEWVPRDTLARVRDLYDYRRRRFSSRLDDRDPEDGFDYEQRAELYRRVMNEVIDAQRAALRRLRDDGEITDEVRRNVEHELDLEQSRLERSDSSTQPRSATISA
ncbi:MAG TPA: Na+/H+ antiporter [Thermoleophilaceae bacterium]|nr:Na+/H+ antiporter [Thermoleophilaceae bacterium]